MTYSTPLLTPVYRGGVSVSFFNPPPAHLNDQNSTFTLGFILCSKLFKSFEEIIYVLTGIVYR